MSLVMLANSFKNFLNFWLNISKVMGEKKCYFLFRTTFKNLTKNSEILKTIDNIGNIYIQNFHEKKVFVFENLIIYHYQPFSWSAISTFFYLKNFF